VKSVVQRLDEAKERVLGESWIQSWSVGLRKAAQSVHFIEHNQMLWLYNLVRAFGMYEYARDRYKSFENNGNKWNDKMSPKDNIEKNIGRNPWGWVPGLPLKPDVDYFADDLKDVPEENRAKVKAAHRFVLKWLATKSPEELAEAQPARRTRINIGRRQLELPTQFIPKFLANRLGQVETVGGSKASPDESEDSDQDDENGSMDDTDDGMIEEAEDNESDTIPKAWETAYDMRPWPDFPDRPSRAQ
jgi:hypothetical protein